MNLKQCPHRAIATLRIVRSPHRMVAIELHLLYVIHIMWISAIAGELSPKLAWLLVVALAAAGLAITSALHPLPLHHLFALRSSNLSALTFHTLSLLPNTLSLLPNNLCA